MTAKEYLKEIKKIDTQIRNKNAELKLLHGAEMATVKAQIDELREKQRQIIKTIEQLPEAEYDVLHRVYIQGETLYEAAAGRNIGYSSITHIHGNALKRLNKIIHKKQE